MIHEGSRLWTYLSPAMRVLVGDGNFLLIDSERHRDTEPTDYSYIVFPYAKMYEGFLKQLFLDLGIISVREYESEHYRIGKALSPNLRRRLGNRSAYTIIEHRFGKDLATRLWHTWKDGRNLVFHFFPNNDRGLTLEQAKHLVTRISETMDAAVDITHVNLHAKK